MIVFYILMAACLSTGIDFATHCGYLAAALIGVGLGSFASALATLERRTRGL